MVVAGDNMIRGIFADSAKVFNYKQFYNLNQEQVGTKAIRYYEVAREIRSRRLSKCIVGLFWWTHFQSDGKFVPENSPTMHFDNHLDPVSLAPSKCRIINHSLAIIGHFRVPPGLCFKTRVGAQSLIWKSFFILMQIKLIFTKKVVHLASF